MFSMWAVLVYGAATALPVFLLYRYESQAWYWHALAVVATVGLGLTPVPPEYQSKASDLVMGFLFVFLLLWGGGGLIVYRPHHREKHA